MLSRMLGMTPTINGAPDYEAEVEVVKRVMPISWRMALAAHTIEDVSKLQRLVKNLNDELEMAWCNEHRDSGRRDGDRRPNRSGRPWANRPYNKDSVSAHDVETEVRDEDDEETDDQEVYAAQASNKNGRPARVFQFPRRDDVKTMTGRNPPGPCPLCGSPAHWKNECPHKDKTNAKEVRISSVDAVNDMYDSLYNTLMLENAASQYVKNESDTVEGHLGGGATSATVQEHEVKVGRRAYVEEVEDEEESTGHANRTVPTPSEGTSEAKASHSSPGPQNRPARIFELRPVRKFAAGQSARGVSVLSARGKLGGLEEREVDLRFDSCADVTLVSKEYFESLKSPPKVKRGAKLRLWQLLDGKAEIEGYADIGIYVKGEDNCWIKAKAEAYIVPDMTVPILLGEDFQRTYEVKVTRNIDQGSRIQFGGCPEIITATPVDKKFTIPRMAQNFEAEASFVKSKASRRIRFRNRRKREIEQERRTEVRLKEDCTLPPRTVVPTRIEHGESHDREWLFERALVSSKDLSHIAIPNCLIAATDPHLPLTNTGDKPVVLKAGTVLGYVQNPLSFFDSPSSLKHLESMLEHSARLSLIVEALSSTLGGETTTQPASAEAKKGPPFEASEEGIAEEDEMTGPKTAEFPDTTIYPSSRMREIIDVGEVPEELKPRVWEMLEERQKAFGFDSRLGQLNARVHIRTEEGLNPIAVPMYGTSPAKRLVIEEQMAKWFEQDVIEASRSPWSAPVIIAWETSPMRGLPETECQDDTRRIPYPEAIRDIVRPVWITSVIFVGCPSGLHAARVGRRG